jgi:hypothetical protein
MTGYDWFEKQLAEVPWSTFYITKKNFNHHSLEKAGVNTNALPKQYLEFMERYGEARLFRRLKSDSHFLTVLIPKPKPECGPNTFLIGGYWCEGNAYIVAGKKGIFVWTGSRLRQISEDFDVWFRKSFQKAKRDIRKAYWPILRRLPVPFSAIEKEIAEAISRHTFSKIAVEPSGNLRVGIKNESDRTISWVEMGVSAPTLLGAISLDVRDLKPGGTKIISRDCYKDMVSPESVSLFTFPKPTPEDRWAFKALRIVNGLE